MSKLPENTPDWKTTPDDAIGILNEELEKILEPEPENYEATVAISKEELASLGLKTDHPPETRPSQLPPEPEPGNYEATVALSKAELDKLGLQSEPPPEMMPPEPSPEPEAGNYEATVAISKEDLAELGLMKDPAPPDVQDTPVTPEINAAPIPDMAAPEIPEVPEPEPPEPEAPDAPVSPSYDNTVDIPPPSPPPQESSGGAGIYSASALEKKYYKQSVRKGRTGKYKLQQRLVSGGMGSILKVLDRDLQRVSAMKVILPKFKNNDNTLSDFIAEAKITGLLEHPNIIPVHELGLTQEDGLYFTMKLAQAEALNDILTEIQRENPEYVDKYNTYHLLNIFRKVCDATSFAHSKSIIHQDIKPHNIMVGDYGEVLLMDWGIARFVGKPQDEDDPLMKTFREDIIALATEKDMIKGSPTFMSPEQVSGEPELIDARTDIFLLGATLYHMFTFSAPYFGNDIYEILHKAETGELIPPDVRNPARQIPGEICRIIMKAMAHKKEERYQTVDDLASDVDDLISGKWSQQDVKVFAAGDMLMRQGEEGEEAYLILSGKVQVFIEANGKKVVLATLKEGDVIGEMSLISKDMLTRSASVEAIEETEAAVLTKHVISQNLKKLPPYMEKIVATLTDRLRTANENIHPHVTGDCSRVVLKQLRLIFRDTNPYKTESLRLPAQAIIEEISHDIGISQQKVKDALIKALKTKLINRWDDNTIQIPDIEELDRITRHN